ncbi:MAG: helix-turn-helix transcriptional regulator [Asgard group archaeon]|nr:helix-turn-helix transcriptional regulator [Asgard group archaeon]
MEKNGCDNDNRIFPCFVPAQRILNLVSKKWSIQLIYLLREGKRFRYNDLKSSLHLGWKEDKISDATLSTRLLELSKEGFLLREVYPELPPKVEYRLSEKGENLSKALEPLVDWTIKICHEE